MRVLLLGASGRTGSLTTNALLSASYTVTALVRTPTSIQPQPGLSLVKGTPINLSDIEEAFISVPADDPIQAVIVTLAVPRTSETPFGKLTGPPFFLRDCVRNAMAAMRAHGVRRLVVMSAFGSGESFVMLAWPLRLLFRWTGMADVLRDHDAVDALVRGEEAEGVEWTLVKPPMLKDGEATVVREFGETGKGVGLMDSATRASVARALFIAVDEGKWKREAIVIANR